jgi:hypothetical protein
MYRQLSTRLYHLSVSIARARQLHLSLTSQSKDSNYTTTGEYDDKIKIAKKSTQSIDGENTSQKEHLQSVTEYYSQYLQEEQSKQNAQTDDYYEIVDEDDVATAKKSFSVISNERGKTGPLDPMVFIIYFDDYSYCILQDLWKLLQHERCTDICFVSEENRRPSEVALTAPGKINVVCTVFSERHAYAVATTVRAAYKRRRHKTDAIIVAQPRLVRCSASIMCLCFRQHGMFLIWEI